MQHKFKPILVILAIIFAGCSANKLVSVSGIVTLNGTPYENAVVSFEPLTDDDDPDPSLASTGLTDENGNFTLHYQDNKPGALVGMHRVKISTKPGKNKTHPNEEPEFVVAAQDETLLKRFEPIPAEWNTCSTKMFEVKRGGTKKANFNIHNPNVKR